MSFREVIFCLQVPSMSRMLAFFFVLGTAFLSRQLSPVVSLSTRPWCVSRLMLFDASSCPAATFTEASKPKSSWNHTPNSRGGSVSRVHVSAACIARSLLQHAAFALRLLLQGDVLDLWRVAWTLRRHPCNLHGRGSRRCGDLFIDRLLIAPALGRSATMSAAVFLTGPRWWMTVRGFEEWTGTRRVMLGWFASGIASRQWRRVLTWGRRDRLPAFYQLDNLIGFPGKIAIRPEWIVPTAVRADLRMVGGRGVLGVRGQKFCGIVGHVYRMSCQVCYRLQ